MLDFVNPIGAGRRFYPEDRLGGEDETGRKTVNPDDHAASVGREVSTSNQKSYTPTAPPPKVLPSNVMRWDEASGVVRRCDGRIANDRTTMTVAR
jgi:hypothetical protein